MMARITRTSREEMETTIAFNRHAGIAECSTADPAMARRWTRAGWPVDVLGRYRDGSPRTWQTAVPWRLAVRVRPHVGVARKSEKPPRQRGIYDGDGAAEGSGKGAAA
jgi:hypothetical protein